MEQSATVRCRWWTGGRAEETSRWRNARYSGVLEFSAVEHEGGNGGGAGGAAVCEKKGKSEGEGERGKGERESERE